MRSRAKSAPAVAAGDNLLAFADFSSMPSQQAGFSVMPGETSDDAMHHKHMKMNTKIQYNHIIIIIMKMNVKVSLKNKKLQYSYSF